MAGIVVVSLLSAWLTGLAWPGLAGGIVGMVLLTWRLVKMLGTLQAALKQSERERTALEQALRTSQKMETLGRLTVGVAHDFNNHLTVISSNVEMVARRLDKSQDRLRRHTGAAMQGVQRAAALTGRLLSFSRQPVPESEMVDVNRMVGGVAGLLRSTLGNRAGFDVVLAAEPWFTWADVNQMETALLSLAVNVHKQSGAGLGITVSNIHADQVAEAVPPGDYIQIAIDGAAEPAELRQRCVADGLSGADLSMARAFVRENGGTIVRSDGAAGVPSLRLLLPRYVPLVQAVPVRDRTPGERAKILVVEDDDLVRGSCVEILRGLDYEVLEAADAMEAFRLITDRGRIDLLFTDLGLPGGVSGRALADAARNVDAGLRVLFTTGHEKPDLLLRADTVLLRKPFEPDELAARVRDVLSVDQGLGPAVAAQG